MSNKSVRYFTLALTLLASTAAYTTASAQSSDPCDDPSTVCVVTGGDPVPIGNIISGDTGRFFVVTGGDPVPVGNIVEGGDSMSLDDLATGILIYYGLE
jgi:hypothetical protein